MAQTYPHWECIIVNDGSTDDTEIVARQYQEKDSHFKYLKKANGGLSSARNAGLKVAKGDWVQFLDSDDYIAPEKFKLSMDLVAENPSVSLVVTDFKMFVDDRLNATPAFCEIKQEYLNFDGILFGWDVKFNIPIHCGFFKTALFDQNPFVESLRISEDWVMWINVFSKNIKAFYLDEPFAYYRINPNSMTKDKIFVSNNLIDTFKYILQILPAEYAVKFACGVLERYKSVVITYENDLTYYKNRLSYRVEKKIKDAARKFIPAKKH